MRVVIAAGCTSIINLAFYFANIKPDLKKSGIKKQKKQQNIN